ncbi:30S ribosomal protein S16 [Candidatus Kuenenbacteria bacterium CG1_02_38_13]|nr:MAG: 30S ribosomal protein S16 [Candidatus Kuenenbacteria bacterium CG1_02_38_13]
MIRLSRTGKKKKSQYRIIIQDKKRDPWGKALEVLGVYDPHTKGLVVKKGRVEYWRSQGAQMSATINNLFVRNNIIEGKKVKATKINKKNKSQEMKKKNESASLAKQDEKQVVPEKKEDKVTVKVNVEKPATPAEAQKIESAEKTEAGE